IERTKVIVHLIDLFPMDGSDPAENYRKVRRELEAFSDALAKKPEVIGANKIDLMVDDEALNKLRADLPDKQILPISGVSRAGTEKLMETLWSMLKQFDPRG
ncbi:MAG: GTPase ObgE, partial [Tepidisphaeraceae bacterium]